MTRKVPPVATAVVALAVLAMIALGIWQLQRSDEKQALVARYANAAALSAELPWPRDPDGVSRSLYRRSTLECPLVRFIETRAGRAQSGTMGWAHVAHCDLREGGAAEIALGWSQAPLAPTWSGGTVSGIIGPHGHGAWLVAAPPQAGLIQLAPPDPRDMPNNHLSYAVQWFLFAATALIIYGLALRARWRKED